MDEIDTYTAVLVRAPGTTDGEHIASVPFTSNGFPQRLYGKTTILLDGTQRDEKFELDGPDEAGATLYYYRLVESEEFGSEEYDSEEY